MTSQSMVRVGAQTLDTPALNVPEHGYLNVYAHSMQQISVSTDEFLCDGLLYEFSGVMTRLGNGDWFFKADRIQAPKLRGKRREHALQEIAKAARQYINDHPEIMEAFKAQAWEAELRRFDERVRTSEYIVVEGQKEIENAERKYREAVASIDGQIEALKNCLDTKPENASYPVLDNEGNYRYNRFSDYLKNYLANLNVVEGTSHDPT